MIDLAKLRHDAAARVHHQLRARRRDRRRRSARRRSTRARSPAPASTSSRSNRRRPTAAARSCTNIPKSSRRRISAARRVEALARIANELAEDVARVLIGAPGIGAVNAPVPDGPEAERVLPFLDVAYRMGRFFPQFASGDARGSYALQLQGDLAAIPANAVRARVSLGPVADHDRPPRLDRQRRKRRGRTRHPRRSAPRPVARRRTPARCASPAAR